jgi:hypothetical protein
MDDDKDRFERAAEYLDGEVTAEYLRMREDELGNAGPHDF